MLPRQLNSFNEEVRRGLPWTVRDTVLPDGSVVLTALDEWTAQRYARAEAGGTGRCFARLNVHVLARVIEVGMVVDLLSVRYDDVDKTLMGDVLGDTVRVVDVRGACKHGSTGWVLGRIRARLVSHDPDTKEWIAHASAPYLGLSCCITDDLRGLPRLG